jgi:carbonic anhydrase
MQRRVPPIAAGRILAAAFLFSLAMAPGIASAQQKQSPIDIVTKNVVVDRNLPNFGPGNSGARQLGLPFTFKLENNVGSPFCSPPGPRCDGTVDKEWGTLKATPVKQDTNPSPANPNPHPDPHVTFGGHGYVLQQFHFHIPSEHLIDGKDTAMEIHLVFLRDGLGRCDAGKYLVIGKRIKEGAENPELNKIFGPTVVLPEDYHSPSTEVPGIVLSRVLGDLSQSYRYDGSLTAPANLGCTPPGTPDRQLADKYFPEVVYWMLLKGDIEMSAAQIKRFADLFVHTNEHGHEEGNSRPPQNLNGRVVKMTPNP